MCTDVDRNDKSERLAIRASLLSPSQSRCRTYGGERSHARGWDAESSGTWTGGSGRSRRKRSGKGYCRISFGSSNERRGTA
jgi:hypothetical protein